MFGLVKVPRIEEAFDSRNLLPSTAIDLTLVYYFVVVILYMYMYTYYILVAVNVFV